MTYAKTLALAAVFAVSAGAAQASDIVVLDSSAPSIEAGALIAEETEVTVPSGASVTVILPSGETKIVTGPFSGRLGASQGSAAAGIADLAGSRGGDTKVLGAVRAPKWEIAE